MDAPISPTGPPARGETPGGRAAGFHPGKAALRDGVQPGLQAGARRWGIVASRFNDEVSAALESGARSCLLAHGAADDRILTLRVPGAFEIPGVARAVLESGRVDAIVGVGTVIRGETPHFDYVCRAVTDGLARLAYESGRPVAFGVLTADTVEQARERAGGSRGNKGWEAALAALEMAELLDGLAESPQVGFRAWAR